MPEKVDKIAATGHGVQDGLAKLTGLIEELARNMGASPSGSHSAVAGWKRQLTGTSRCQENVWWILGQSSLVGSVPQLVSPVTRRLGRRDLGEEFARNEGIFGLGSADVATPGMSNVARVRSLLDIELLHSLKALQRRSDSNSDE